MTKAKIALIDYGAGNLFSVERALQAVKANYFLTNKIQDLVKADKLILPGVGAFGYGMKGLRKAKLVESIRQQINKGKPILGICLGMQLLMSQGYEFGKHQGLNLIAGEARRLKTKAKLPQIGWNTIKVKKKNPLLESIKNDFFYFVHSYVVRPKNKKVIIATTDYGGDEFCSVISYNQIYGVQFHPEKSGDKGLKIYANFCQKS